MAFRCAVGERGATSTKANFMRSQLSSKSDPDAASWTEGVSYRAGEHKSLKLPFFRDSSLPQVLMPPNELFQSRSGLPINETGGRSRTFRPRFRGGFAGSALTI